MRDASTVQEGPGYITRARTLKKAKTKTIAGAKKKKKKRRKTRLNREGELE